MTRPNWSDGEAYDRYIGRWSRPVADAFLAWLGVPARRRWLDVGCGTGALASRILRSAAPAEVVGVDPSEGFIATARASVPHVTFLTGDAQELPLPDRRFDVVVSALVINFVPDQSRALREFTRVTTPGGVVAAYVWDVSEGMGIIRQFWDAAISLDPAAAEADEGSRHPLCRPDPLRGLWQSAGLTDVTVEAIEVPTVFTDFDDYWQPFLAGRFPAPGYAMSLSEEHRAELRETLRTQLPTRADGTIPLTARAWAVRGVRSPA